MIVRSPNRAQRVLATGRAGALSVVLLALGAGGALAQSCNEDIGALQQKRNVQIEALNKLTKATGGKLDPIAACPRLRQLASVEQEMLAYMEKNQNWCSIPGEIIEQVKGGVAKTSQIAAQACKIAAQARRMQEQQTQMAPLAPALPRGPL